jgi:hypothetical protein
MVEFIDFLFEPSTGLIDPDAKDANGNKTPRWGIAPAFNAEAIKTIEDSLDMPNGQVEFLLEKAAKERLVARKERFDKNKTMFVTYHLIDPDYKRDNSEQLRKVGEAITKFKDRHKKI